uniref:Ig-like domain-containing protein n=1 Tax=Cyprinus carpio TaxID=7962 RepID=A0A8C2JSN0_CYPCA
GVLTFIKNISLDLRLYVFNVLHHSWTKTRNKCFTITSVLIEAPKARLTVQTETSQIFRGETVTLTCDIQGEGWRYTWQCGDEQHNSDEEEFKITVQFKQSCKCKGCRESFCSEWSDAETLTDSDKPKVTVKPQSSVFTGDTVTLICDVRRSTGRTIYWYKNFKRIKAGSETETLREVRVSDGGRYACSVENKTALSQGVMLTVEGQPKPVVRVQPDGRVFRGQIVTLTCDIQDTDVTNWSYIWNKDDSETHVSQSQEYRISSVSESHTGNYSCTGRETGGSRYSHTSEKVTLTVSGECMAPMCVACLLTLHVLFVCLFILICFICQPLRCASLVQTYDWASLLNVHVSANALPYQLQNGSYYIPPPLLLTIPGYLRHWPCSLLAWRRR